MKTEWIPVFFCEKCGTRYESREKALECESKAITQDNGFEIGENVLVTQGDGAWTMATITKKFVCSRHYQGERYWHTVAVVVEFLEGGGSRALTYDEFEIPY